MKKPWPKKKPKALWMTAFPEQARALRPEHGKAGGIKGQSGSAKVRADVYGAIAKMFKAANPTCQICRVNATADVHHTRGRLGLLLFDVRYFKAACRTCHNWIGEHPAEAQERGLVDLEHWNKTET